MRLKRSSKVHKIRIHLTGGSTLIIKAKNFKIGTNSEGSGYISWEASGMISPMNLSILPNHIVAWEQLK